MPGYIIITCINRTSDRIDFIFCDFTRPLGIDENSHLRPLFLEQDIQARSKLNNSSNVLSTYYLSGTMQRVFIHSLIHQLCTEYLPCSRPHISLKILRLSVPWMQKPVPCHAALAFIPLASIFPKRTMLFRPVKRLLCPRRTCEKEASSAPKSDVLLRILCLATWLFTV